MRCIVSRQVKRWSRAIRSKTATDTSHDYYAVNAMLDLNEHGTVVSFNILLWSDPYPNDYIISRCAIIPASTTDDLTPTYLRIASIDATSSIFVKIIVGAVV
jgi:hypothetical protein